jgi:hypothetical protein
LQNICQLHGGIGDIEKYQTSIKWLLHAVEEFITRIHTLQEEASLNALCLAIKVFLQFLLPNSPRTDRDRAGTAIELMTVLKGPNIRLCSCLELTFWQLMMGRIAASDSVTQDWYISMLQKALHALQLPSWEAALRLLKASFWIERIFLHSCYSVWLELVEGHETNHQVASHPKIGQQEKRRDSLHAL